MLSLANGNGMAKDPDGRQGVPPWKYGVSPESMTGDRRDM